MSGRSGEVRRKGKRETLGGEGLGWLVFGFGLGLDLGLGVGVRCVGVRV